MEFSEFKEFDNPEEADYDITSSLKKDDGYFGNPYADLLMERVGILEDGEWVKYGLTDDDYFSPTEETIKKVDAYLASHDNQEDKGLNL